MSRPRPQDWEENDDGDEGLHPSPPAKRPRCSGCCDDHRQLEMLLKEVRSMLKGQNEKIESMQREHQELREKVSCLTPGINTLDGYLQQSPASRVSSDQNISIPLRLQFVNSCSNDKYSTHKIEADDENPLKIAIYDNNNRIIKCEPFASMRVRVVAIHGDFDNDHEGQWTKEYFDSKIVNGRPEKERLLSGQLYFRLQDGVGYLNNAKFLDNSSFVPSKRFKLGVKAFDGRISERIQEGITGSFAVKDVRGYSTKKNPNPSPRDPVYKLNRIAMNGDRRKLLEQNGINTVEEFLHSYRKNPEELRKILGRISDQDWYTIVNHARKCYLGPEIYSSFIQERNASHEHEPFSISNGRNILKGSCSMQPSPTLQGQLDVQVTNQQISSRFYGLSCGAPSEDLQPNSANRNVMPHGELDGIQVTGQQVSSVRTEILSVSPMDNNTLEGSSSWLSHGFEEPLSFLEKFPLNEDEDASLWPPLTEIFLYDAEQHEMLLKHLNEIPYDAVEQNGGHTPASEAGSIGSRGLSPASGAGSTSFRGPSPVREAGSPSYRGPSPVSGAGSTSFRGPSPVRGAGSPSYRGPSPVSGAGSPSFRGPSPVRAGSPSYRGPSPVSGAGSPSFRGPSPVSGAGSPSYRDFHQVGSISYKGLHR